LLVVVVVVVVVWLTEWFGGFRLGSHFFVL